jgi:hypothetical protein
MQKRKFRWNRGNLWLYCTAVARALCPRERLWATALDDIPARPPFVGIKVRPSDAE